ncbi:hypothetical protein TanjilG_20552 [Lupinus angustifolius]|uniref:Uncharacterized protein n=1 Tax=Lupinus angustifolius TaxID=3871 RepID=A0A1J7FNJ9_LUPAN|nr:hypothetical protein TanjilG_20552 [Lupinus angustifolius]
MVKGEFSKIQFLPIEKIMDVCLIDELFIRGITHDEYVKNWFNNSKKWSLIKEVMLPQI